MEALQVKVLYIAPGEEPMALDIEDRPSVIAGLCGGVPIAMPFPDDWTALLFDPEAKAKGAPENFRYKGAAFHGPVLVAGMRRGRSCHT